MSTMLFEKTFYATTWEEEVRALIPQVPVQELAQIILDARLRMHLRHLPLFLLANFPTSEGARGVLRSLVRQTIRRPDEMAELLALYWKTGVANRAIPNGIKRGIADVFPTFSEYQLAKWDRRGAVSLRDVMLMGRFHKWLHSHGAPSCTD